MTDRQFLIYESMMACGLVIGVAFVILMVYIEGKIKRWYYSGTPDSPYLVIEFVKRLQPNGMLPRRDLRRLWKGIWEVATTPTKAEKVLLFLRDNIDTINPYALGIIIKSTGACCYHLQAWKDVVLLRVAQLRRNGVSERDINIYMQDLNVSMDDLQTTGRLPCAS